MTKSLVVLNLNTEMHNGFLLERIFTLSFLTDSHQGRPLVNEITIRNVNMKYTW